MKSSNPYWKTFAAATALAFGIGGIALSSAHAEDNDGPGHESCAAHDGGHEGHGVKHGGRFGMAGGDHLPHFLRGVELTDTQRDKIFALRHEQQPRERELMKAMRASRQELHALAGKDSFDAAQARALADRHGKAMADMAMMHAEMGAKLRALLTPEQRKQADEKRGHGDHDGMPKHGRGHGRG